MDNYKFGNLICSMREANNLTQKEFAKILDVSDKAISKWENGQAIPRMETLEKIAKVFATTVEDLITLSKDNVKSITVQNDFGTLLHFIIDDDITSIMGGEQKKILIDSTKNEHRVTVFGELSLEDMVNDIEEPNGLKDKIVHKGMKYLSKWADRIINRQTINIKCYYELTNLENGELIEVENCIFSAGDKMWIFRNLIFSYPKLLGSFNSKLVNAECQNKSDVFAGFKRSALTSELGISISLMLIAYPFRKMYFKSVIKPKGLMKFLKKSDYYVEKNNKEKQKSNKRKHPILRTIGIIVLLIIVWFGIEIGLGIMNVELDKPYLVSSDFSTITYGREEYFRIDELPKDTISSKLLGAEVWTDARIDGYSKTDQYLNENKVCEFTDKSGNTYLWLVPNYIETITDEETGDYKEYEDLDEHYVYKLNK